MALKPTTHDMTQIVNNIIESYGMGAFRALAQEPPQNSFDQHRDGAPYPVYVDYRFHERTTADGKQLQVLTITDRNTTGLRGDVLSEEQEKAIKGKYGYLHLPEDQNWSKWEGMGLTKQSDALGSRGQGKAAPMYFSQHDGPAAPVKRMVILYDTLLPDGTYRLGARLALPDDNVYRDPHTKVVPQGEDAKLIMAASTAYLTDWPVEEIPLQLEPLTEVGARIIIPFLPPDALEAFESGALAEWLRILWWRPIQMGELCITIGREGGPVTTIDVPEWWHGCPWEPQQKPGDLFIREDVPLIGHPELKIKRIVFRYNDDWKGCDIEMDDPALRYQGVQILRAGRRPGGQWIMTYMPDTIPADRRSGFRGFVEFDRKLNQELRSIEKSAHDGFADKGVYRPLRDTIKELARQYAQERGWVKSTQGVEHEDKARERMRQRVADRFLRRVRGAPGKAPSVLLWNCSLEMDYPHPETTRVELDETIRGITVSCSHDPTGDRQDVEAKLILVDPDLQTRELPTGSRNRTTKDGSCSMGFGDLKVVRAAKAGAPKEEVAFPKDGKYQLVAVCYSGGKEVVRRARNIYVRTNPPVRHTRPVTAGIWVTKPGSGSQRIDNGDVILVQYTITNNTGAERRVRIESTLGDTTLIRPTQVLLPPRPAGDAPQPHAVYRNVLILTGQPASDPDGLYAVLEWGKRYAILTDITDEDGTILRPDAYIVVGEIPEQSAPELPFKEKMWDDGDPMHAPWELRRELDDQLSLMWTSLSPEYRFAEAASNLWLGVDVFSGLDYFWAQTHCGALVEYALDMYRRSNNEDKWFTYLAGEEADATTDVRKRFRERLRDLFDTVDNPVDCLNINRDLVSLMLQSL
jgi:hypothetical protein